MWEPHTIDRFATQISTQLEVYNSCRFYDSYTSGVDALAQPDWALHNNLVNSPFTLLNKVLDVIEKQGAVATVVAPLWRGHRFLTRLRQMLIASPIRLPMSKRTIWHVDPMAKPLKNLRWRLFA